MSAQGRELCYAIAKAVVAVNLAIQNLGWCRLGDRCDGQFMRQRLAK
jgi:hypothetical protein